MKPSGLLTAFVMAAMAVSSWAADVAQPYPAPESGKRLTPPVTKEPSINGARVYGVRPGSPVLFQVPVSGERPMKMAVKGLPSGLKFDPETGIITGSIKRKGDIVLTVGAENEHGKAVEKLTIKVGDTLSLTPPMAWSSWYSFSEGVSQEGILKMARAMKDSGLINHGWSFINIDDCWQSVRGGPLKAIQPNDRFPDMKALCDEIHAMGLKAGIYSTPWIGTYAGFIGGSSPNKKFDISAYEIPRDNPARRQEHQYFGTWPGLHKQKVDKTGPVWMFDKDAKQWGEWGFDYVKVDWKPNDIPTTERIAKDLKEAGRDIVLSLSNEAPIENAEGLSQLANAWRTTADIHDNWNSVSSRGFSQEPWQKYTSPGHWNDPDILQIGMIGNAGQQNQSFRPTNLTPDEQFTQMTLWTILSAPLIISCDMADMDEFTEGLLVNDEVIAVNQDPEANPAKKAYEDGTFQVWTKKLSDGSLAVGFFNLGDKGTFKVSLDKLGLEGNQTVRDLWSRKDVGTAKGEFGIELNTHGATLLRFKTAK